MMTYQKKQKIRIAVVLLAFAALVAFTLIALNFVGPSFGVYLHKPTPKEYGERALSLMNNGYYANSEEWWAVSANARAELDGAQSYEDVYPILREAISVAGGKHSRLVMPDELAESEAASSLPSAEVREDGLIVLRLPTFLGDPARCLEYANTGIQLFKTQPNSRGLILDLRGNNGGDLAPMAGAVAPLFQDGELIRMVYSNGSAVSMTLQNGTFNGGSVITVEDYKLEQPIPVAILIDEGTASSAEALLLFFRGRENVRVFGAPTAGYASVNVTYPFYDGVQMWLTVGAGQSVISGETFCDDPIPPDVESETPEEAAAAWLLSLSK